MTRNIISFALASKALISYICRVHFSCKITSAVLSTLEHRGEDLSSFYDPSLPQMEHLRDPSGWMSAPDMEAFFETLVRMSWSPGDEPILVEAGHAGPKNHAWGVLDSVLRMMPRPQEILHQPERFLSYFISPQPPIENLQRDESGLSFDLPLPAEQYPLVASYLKAAFESLPLYVGQPLAVCTWEEIHFSLRWPGNQETMFEQDPGHQISPELLQRVVADHQRLQRELEERNREIQRKDEELSQARRDLQGTIGVRLAAPLGSLDFEEAAPGYALSQNLARLQDYMVRAQQLVTLLAGAALSKKDPSAKEALRRTDWEQVKSQSPRVFAECFQVLRRLQNPAPAPLLKPTSSSSSLEESSHV